MATSELTEPIVGASKHAKDSTHTKDVVEVSDHIVGIMEAYVQTTISKDNASETTSSEEEEEANGKEHRCIEVEDTFSYSAESAKDLDACGDGYDHSGRGEVSSSINVKTNRIHMMTSHYETEKANSKDRIDHTELAKDGLAAEGSYHMADDAKGRENEDINLGVAKEPEEVLEEHRITTTVSIEEDSAEVTVGKQHSDTTSKNRDGNEKE